ncbi:hypothetical protein [Bacillus sp. FJAT-27251]|uniref:hypothetical protein n=1 Tax=Bacillus sp. FJAT-27251 TaxID=1684142 RepID=UPI0006A7E615|nr:hypothetical protein [Bacillus sp. FJAT-27251]
MELENRRLSTSVQQALYSANLELLPEEIRTDDLFNWIYQFTTPVNTLNIVEDDRWNVNRERFVVDSIAKMVKNSTMVCLNYYFTSIFMIGRQMKISYQQIESIRQSLSESNLDRTFYENMDIIPQHDKSEFIQYLTKILEEALDVQYYNYGVACELWDMWKHEVEHYKNMLEDIEISGEIYNVYNLGRDAPSKREDVIYYIIQLTSYEFVQLPLHKMLIKNGLRSHASYDEIFAENLYLFSSVLHYLFPPFENREINARYYRKYFSRLSKGIKKLSKVRKQRKG